MSDMAQENHEKTHRPFLNVFQNETSNMWAENRLLRFIGTLAFLGTLILSVSVLTLRGSERTIIVPFGQTVEGMLLVGDKPSDAYLMSIGRNIVQLTGTYTSSGLQFQLDEVLKIVHPSHYGDLRDEFRNLVNQLSEFREITFATHVRYESEFFITDSTIRIPVSRVRYVGRSRTEDVGYVEIDYLVEEGRFWIIDVGFKAEGKRKNVQIDE